CEDCKGKKYSNVIWNRCKKGSFTASLVTYLEAKINDWLDYERYVDLYISPSMFLRNKFIEYGFNQEKIVHISNFIELDDFIARYDYENHLLFIGRLEKGKGLGTLIKAFAKAKTYGPILYLKIAGAGSLEKELKEMVEHMKIPNVKILGFKHGEELEDLTKNAKAIVIPSELYENYPFAGLEAMAYGKPIIASRIGGIPEQVEDGVTGFLFEPFDENDLAAKIDLLNSLSKEEIEKMGRKARKKVETINSKEVYLQKILAIYEDLIDAKKMKVN
ncbi:MAG: glycosyltransferase family 4 protein, partial [Nanoarchaeota archaeon]|nr:glycosyltransferase family 4 protein [Nanoarchaeota archaeon]